MKKLLVILTACFVMVSCQFWHETFDSPAECTEWYLEQIYEAGLDGDVSKVAELNADYQEWLLGLDESEAAEAGLAALAWLESHRQWWHETFSSPEECAVWYCEQIAEAEKAGDEEKKEELDAAAEEWMNSLDKEDKEKAQGAAMAWILSNMKL